jgi:alkanesulfonate monooxygenase SsuD/methylene tetrahydromethanopterin reductase-like flavin-dependent oxidoreductase (luciferase family)
VAPGEQQPESDHAFRGDGADAGLHQGRHWRHATGWFSYVLTDAKKQARTVRLTYARQDAGRRFDIRINGHLLAEVTLDGAAAATDTATQAEFYTRDYEIPPDWLAGDKLTVRFEARDGSLAGGLYGLRLLR